MKTNAPQKNKEFFGIKSEEAKAIYSLYKECVLKEMSHDDMCTAMATFLQSSYELPQPVSTQVAARIIQNFSSGAFQETLIDNIVISSIQSELDEARPKAVISYEDYAKFVELTHADPEMTTNLKKLLLSFIIFYRLNYHPSGWIKYDKKNIFYLSGANKLTVAQQEKMTKYLHTHYGLNMRVIGSNQPTPCYNMYWLQDQPPAGSTNNPMITLGFLTPEDIDNIVAKSEKGV